VIEHSPSSAEPTYVARFLVGRAEVVVNVVVAIFLLIAAGVTCGFAVIIAIQQLWSGKPLGALVRSTKGGAWYGSAGIGLPHNLAASGHCGRYLKRLAGSR
jgi:hypothetical protein